MNNNHSEEYFPLHVRMELGESEMLRKEQIAYPPVGEIHRHLGSNATYYYWQMANGRWHFLGEARDYFDETLIKFHIKDLEPKNMRTNILQR